MKKKNRQSVEQIWLWEKGEVRNRNENVICIRKVCTAKGVCALYGIFEGIDEYGGEAAALAGNRMEEWFDSQLLLLLEEADSRLPGTSKKLYRRLIQNSGALLFAKLNEELFRMGRRNKCVFGCTASVCLLWQETVYWFHVGNGGVYCSKRQQSLTKVHATPEGELFRCLGGNRDGRVDFGSSKLSGYLFMICNDGFLKKIAWKEIRESLLSCGQDKKQLEKRLKKIGEYQRLRRSENNSSAILFWRGR